MSTQFEGVWVPIITPFHGETIDRNTLTRLARRLATQGIAGFVAGATTGEGTLLSDSERETVFATLREAAPELPVVQGISEASTACAVAQARRLAPLRPDGLLVTPPLYVRPTQAGIRRHFEAVVEASDRPLLVYNIPYRTGVNVELETLQALVADPRVVGVKECGGNVERTLRLVHETPLRVLPGDDNQVFAGLCLGAHGMIAASAHIATAWHVRLYEQVKANRLPEARRIAVALRSLIGALFAEPNPAPVKALLAMQGYGDGSVRLPFLPASEALAERLQSELDQLQTLLGA